MSIWDNPFFNDFDWHAILGDKCKKGEVIEIDPLFGAAVAFMQKNCTETLGVFRIPGSAKRAVLLRGGFTKGQKKNMAVDLSGEDVHTVASLLTNYLRTREEPLLTFALADEWIAAAGIEDASSRFTTLRELMERLPPVCHIELFLILRLLLQIDANAKVTKMGFTNLGTIFGPMICHRKDSNPATELLDMPRVSALCIDLLTHFEDIFGVSWRMPPAPVRSSPSSSGEMKLSTVSSDDLEKKKTGKKGGKGLLGGLIPHTPRKKRHTTRVDEPLAFPAEYYNNNNSLPDVDRGMKARLTIIGQHPLGTGRGRGGGKAWKISEEERKVLTRQLEAKKRELMARKRELEARKKLLEAMSDSDDEDLHFQSGPHVSFVH